MCKYVCVHTSVHTHILTYINGGMLLFESLIGHSTPSMLRETCICPNVGWPCALWSPPWGAGLLLYSSHNYCVRLLSLELIILTAKCISLHGWWLEICMTLWCLCPSIRIMMYHATSLLFIWYKVNVVTWCKIQEIQKDKPREVSPKLCSSANPALLCREKRGNLFLCIHPERAHAFICDSIMCIFFSFLAFYTNSGNMAI